MSDAQPAIQVEGVQFHYAAADARDKGFALQVPDVRLPAGKTLVCIGPSGSGKSTFLSLLAGILLPATGRIQLWGEDLSGRNESGRRDFRVSRIGLVFQEFELLPHLSVRENIQLPYFVNRNLSWDETAEQALMDLTSVTGIQDHLRKKPRQLSQGERQRVALCRAMVTRPELLLADEPTGNLDPDNTNRVLDTLLSEVKRRAATLVMVTHDHSLVSSFDLVLDFRSGTLQATS